MYDTWKKWNEIKSSAKKLFTVWFPVCQFEMKFIWGEKIDGESEHGELSEWKPKKTVTA